MSVLFVGFKTDDVGLQVAINQASSRLNHTTAGWVRMLVMRELQQQGLMEDPYSIGRREQNAPTATGAVPPPAKVVPSARDQQIIEEMQREIAQLKQSDTTPAPVPPTTTDGPETLEAIVKRITGKT